MLTINDYICAINQGHNLIVIPLVQAGTSVPMFALTEKGKELLLERVKEIEAQLLVNTTKLPVLPEHKQPKTLV